MLTPAPILLHAHGMLGTVAGRYRLEREIGRGGMGSIWVAFDAVLQRRVAVKRLQPERHPDSQWIARFQWEAQVVARLQHPNVISVHDFGIDDGTPYIVMELLEGEDLGTRLRRQGILPIASVVEIVSSVGKALSAAHAAGIVHCDLKPANVFLARGGVQESVKVLDFGVAWMMSPVDPNNAEPKPIEGTPAYMSPEQISGDNLDRRTDLWSLTVLAYEALTGRAPFANQPLHVLFGTILGGREAPPSTLRPELSTAFDSFIARGLAKAPADRFESANELVAAFTAAAERAEEDRPAKILVVDDEPDARHFMQSRFRRKLRERVYEFLFAPDGEAALELLRLHSDVDLALVDINMPRMNGLTLLGRVAEVAPLLKVIIVSAYGDMQNVRTAMRSGAYDFVIKPIESADLEATMEKALRDVRGLKRALRNSEENRLLRMLVGGGVADRLLPVLRTAESSLPSESISATVAFVRVCDVDGFGSRVDPEEVSRVLNAHFDVVVPRFVALRGVVDRFVGNTLLAVFRGEGHASRALEACVAVQSEFTALDARDSQRMPFVHKAAIGLSMGTMASVTVGSRTMGRLDHTIVGDPVGTSERLAMLAGPGEILICERTRRALPETFHYEPRSVETYVVPESGKDVYLVRGRSPSAPAPLTGTITYTVPVGRTVDEQKTNGSSEPH